MKQRAVTYRHLRHALASAYECVACTPAALDRWRVAGRDLDGDELAAVVAIEDGLIVVTVF